MDSATQLLECGRRQLRIEVLFNGFLRYKTKNQEIQYQWGRMGCKWGKGEV